MKKIRFIFGSRPFAFAFILGASLFLASCGGNGTRNGSDGGDGSMPQDSTDTTTTVYRADLHSLNDSITQNSVNGTATIRIKGDTMFINVMAAGLAPDMTHMMHIHGFLDGKDATCASMDQDTNSDGIIDEVEARDASGVTIIPFNGNPAELDIKGDGYPEADQQGIVTYNDTVMLSELRSAMKQKYGTDSLQLENKVIYIHGVPDDTELPESVQSLPDVPASKTLPIACGELEKVDDSWLPF